MTNIATPKSVNKWFEFSRDEAVVRQSILSSHQRASYASYDAKIGSPNPLDINEALHASADALQVCQPHEGIHAVNLHCFRALFSS